MDYQINVINDEDRKSFKITYSHKNKYTNRINNKTFYYYYGTKNENEVPTTKVIHVLLQEILSTFEPRQLFGTTRYETTPVTPKHIKTILTRELKKKYKSNKGRMQMNDINSGNSKAPKSNDLEINKFGPYSEFKPDETGRTTAIIGSSFSGKTYFLVQQLNKLNEKDYDKIFIFTESTNSKPLQDLNKKLPVKIFNQFVPQIPKLLKDINEKTKNRFKFLIVLDDIVNELKGKMVSKMLLVLRNSNISTILVTQYSKLISPQGRGSIHHFYFTGMKVEDWEYILRAFGLGSHLRPLLHEQGSYQKLSERTKETINGKYILFYNNRKDEINFFLR
jgi:hypothetical protein